MSQSTHLRLCYSCSFLRKSNIKTGVWGLSVTFLHPFTQLSASLHIQIRSNRLNQAGWVRHRKKRKNSMEMQQAMIQAGSSHLPRALRKGSRFSWVWICQVPVNAMVWHSQGSPCSQGCSLCKEKSRPNIVKELIINWERAIINHLFVLDDHNLSFMVLSPLLCCVWCWPRGIAPRRWKVLLVCFLLQLLCLARFLCLE